MNPLIWDLLAMGIALLALWTSYRLSTTRQPVFGVLFSIIGILSIGALFIDLGKTVTPSGFNAGMLGCVLIASLQLRVLFLCIEIFVNGQDCREGELD